MFINMPGFGISLNGKTVVTVSTEGMNVFSVRVGGDVISLELASLDVSGGYYGDDSENTHFIWLSEQEISAGDEVEVVFLQEASTSQAGKTIEELHPDEQVQCGPPIPIDMIFRHLAGRPKLREHFAFSLVPPSGEVITAQTEQDDHSFGFSVLWNWTRPEEARVSLSSTSLENIEKRQSGADHARFKLHFGERVRLRVSA
jgi:hypothetical protein